METGTLKELNAKPGDVVECVTENYVETKAIAVGDRFTVNGNGEVDAPKGATGLCATFRIISRATPQPDLTAITTPFGLLDAATQETLRAHGGPYQWFGQKGWQTTSGNTDCWVKCHTYRVKPAPKVEEVGVNWFVDKLGLVQPSHIKGLTTPVRATFNRIDGVIDLSSYRLEARDA
jgi:hypothetical protein